MPIDFPNSPAVNDTHSAAGRTWQYNGTSWILLNIVGVISAGQVGTTELAANSVTSAKIANGTIVAEDIANNTITNTQIAANVAAANLGFTPASTGKSIAMSIVFGG